MPDRSAPTSPPASQFRPEIQALRALAVLLVIVFHLWPTIVPGGYVGVDVFFVISGFLITTHLVKEADASATVSLSQFYARRIRRLLPAALVVLAATVIAVLLWVPQSLWRQFLTEVAASALYVVNWVLAANAVDYFAADNLDSPVQHYWSLSVEEQFYIVWPLLVVSVYWFARRSERKRAVLASAFAAIFALSLTWSIVGAFLAQQFTYFATPAHAWEFAAGGLVSLALTSAPFVARVRAFSSRAMAIASWLGFGVVVASAFALDEASRFPGYLALAPVLATLAVIVAGTPQDRFAPTPLIASRPVQFVGDVSYSAYLWHWPLIVIAPFALVRDLTLVDKLVIFGATLVLAWVSKNWIEDAVRTAPRLRKRSLTFAGAVIASGVLVASSIIAVTAHESRAPASEKRVNESIAGADPCFGALALVSGEDCEYRTSVDPRIGDDPSLGVKPNSREGECTYVVGDLVRECRAGASDSDAQSTIVLIGDSHMTHYRPAFTELGKKHEWQYRYITHDACPAVVTEWSRSDSENSESNEHCIRWREAMIDYVAQSTDVDLIIASNYTQKYAQIETAENRAQLADAFATTWKRWTDAGIPVMVIADDPLTNKQGAAVCVAQHPRDPEACALPRSEAIGNDALVAAVENHPNPLVSLADFSDSYCDDEWCYSALGGVVAYADTHHISVSFARSLAPLLEPYVEDALARGPRSPAN